MERARRRRRGPGLEVDHEAIRRARLEAGLSLSEVAGTELSRASVHRVERGLARPSMATLRLIAQRLGARAEDFLRTGHEARAAGGLTDEEAILVARVERLSHGGRSAEVIAEVAELQKRGFGPRAEAMLHLLAAIAHVQLLEPALALVHLRRARPAFSRLGDEWQAIECMGWEAAALDIQEDTSALDVALEAVRRCGEVEGVPPSIESRVLCQLASIYLSRHEWAPALDAYEGALAAAQPVRDLAGMTRLYEGMSIAHQGLGDLPMAAVYAQRAVALSSVMANHAALARLENNLAVLMLRAGRWDEAEAHLQRAMDHCEAGGIVHGLSHVLLSLAQLYHLRKDYGRAEWYARRTINSATEVGEQQTCSLGHQWLGRILAALGRREESEVEFEAALKMLEPLDAPRRRAECHQAYAEVLEQFGEVNRALVHWREAARLRNPLVDSAEGDDWIQPVNLAN
jgi:tetratricopeptide (TPR) repeat protein/DNA-binding XRE family transcriptional regulator